MIDSIMDFKSLEIFSQVEVEQLVEMLHLSPVEVHLLVDAVTSIFHDAAVFGNIDMEDLIAHGCHPNVSLVIEKSWRKKGRNVAKELLGFRSVDPSFTLKQSQWRMHLNMGQSSLAGQSNPVAIMQLELESNANKVGTTNEHVAA